MATSLKHATENLSKAYARGEQVFGEVAETTKGLYREGQRWLPEHYREVAIVSATALGACLVGFAAGRTRTRSAAVALAETPKQSAAAERGLLAEMDIAPFFRFLKLWMLYRVATRD